MKNIQVGPVFTQAWESTKNNWPMLLVLGLIYMAVSVAINLCQTLIGKISPIFGVLAFTLVGFVISVVFNMILIKFALRVAEEDGKKVELFSELELESNEVVRYLLTSLLVTAIIFVAIIVCLLPIGIMALLTVGAAVFSLHSEVWKALIGPGLACLALAVVVLGYLGLAMSQAQYACLSQGKGPVDSITESWRLTKNVKGDLGLLFLANFGIIFAGILCCCVGAIPAVMIVFLAQPIVYRSLVTQSEAN